MANCSMCGGPNQVPNYVKKIDPYPPAPSGMMFGDRPDNSCGRRGSDMANVQICLPTLCGPPNQSPGTYAPGQPASVINVPTDLEPECPTFVCEPCPPPPPIKVWLLKSSPVPQKSACMPSLGNNGEQPQMAKLMICLPCPPPQGIGTVFLQGSFGNSNQRMGECPFPFAVPQKVEGDRSCKSAGGPKCLPPPQKRNCPAHCIHVSDLKGERKCTYYDNIPCVAHCFNTPLRSPQCD